MASPLAVTNIAHLTDAHTVRIYDDLAIKNPIDNGLLLTLPLPPTMEMKLNSTYSNFFEKGFGAANALKTVLNTAGLSVSFKWSSIEVWQDTDPLSFTFKLDLVAREDAYQEVYLPILKLLSIASPDAKPVSIFGGVLIPPGPNAYLIGLEELVILSRKLTKKPGDSLITKGLLAIQREAKNAQVYIAGSGNVGRTFTLKVGKFFELNKLILQNVSPTFGAGDGNLMPINYTGMPLTASVNLTFRGTRIFTVNADGINDKYCADHMKDYVGLSRNANVSESNISSQCNQKEEEKNKLFSKSRAENFYAKFLSGVPQV